MLFLILSFFISEEEKFKIGKIVSASLQDLHNLNPYNIKLLSTSSQVFPHFSQIDIFFGISEFLLIFLIIVKFSKFIYYISLLKYKINELDSSNHHSSLFQNLRFSLQKNLNKSISTVASTYVRFIFALPFAAILFFIFLAILT